MSNFTGQYFDGLEARAHAVEVQVQGSNLVIQGERFCKYAPLSELKASPALARIPRTLTLSDSSRLVLPDSPWLSALLDEGSPRIARWERSGRMVALASLVLVAVTCALYFLAIPWAADALVRTMGRDTEARLFGSALKQWDDASVWGPSALSARQQEGIRSQLLNSLGADVLKSEAIHFRASSTLGPNAMALPGGHIVITDALIALLSAQELSAVVAHEAGHLHHRHGVRIMARQMGGSGFMAMVGSAFGLHDMAATLATQLGVTRYSREFESQADAFAMDAMQASGLTPCLLASALRKLEAASTTGAQSHADWLSTHPSTQDRIGRVAAMAHAQCSPAQ